MKAKPKTGTERNYVIRYETWVSYNATSEENAIKMFIQDGHDEDEIIEVS